MKVDRLLAHPGEPIETVCFPEQGIVTVSDVLADGTRIGIGHIGFDGFVCWPVLLGANRSPHEVRVTAAGGSAIHIAPADLLRACSASSSLREQLLRFVQVFLVQLSRTIVSSLTQSVDTRLCRWTLMAHDRIEGDDIKVTHDEIAVMLAVRRASVTDALHILEGEGLIRCRRGVVTVRDRVGLLRHAGETYGLFEAEYSRLIAPFPR
jgi:CRP-like cAMP-binding protein